MASRHISNLVPRRLSYSTTCPNPVAGPVLTSTGLRRNRNLANESYPDGILIFQFLILRAPRALNQLPRKPRRYRLVARIAVQRGIENPLHRGTHHRKQEKVRAH